MSTYVLISAARNEEGFIEQTLRSVVGQSVLPQRWAIVSDGSTDATDGIVKRYAEEHAFLELLRVKPDPSRNFGSKARAVNAGYARLRHHPYELVGILDADVALPPDYYEQMMVKFAAHPELGLSGGLLAEKVGDRFITKTTSVEWSVRGPVQMFRRTCWESIEGYRYLPYGGVDTVAEVMCRMRGWKVRSFADLRAHHLRPTGTATHGALRAAYRTGTENYKNGFLPLFMLGRCIKQLRHPPFIVGGLAMGLGYALPALRREERQIDDEFVRFLRKEQMRRLWARDSGGPDISHPPKHFHDGQHVFRH
jgi:glycosyltransferase involved in cell wall biosynthesis